jgi:hypothetical protein
VSDEEEACGVCGSPWTYGWDPDTDQERCRSREAERLFREAIRRHLADNGEPRWRVEDRYATSNLRILGIVEHIYLEEVEWAFPREPQRALPTGHAVYRHFTAEGVLLYVGYSSDVERRQRAHRRDAPWWGESARIQVTFFPTRDEALRAELGAIRTEHPLWNVQGNAR